MAVLAWYRRNQWVYPYDWENDPWGRPIFTGGSFQLISLGPDGELQVDFSKGGPLESVGDDVVVTVSDSWLSLLAAWSRELLGGIAILLAWLLVVPLRSPRSPHVGLEAARALLLAVPPAGFVALVCLHTEGLESLDAVWLAVSPRVASGGSAALLVYVAALWWRLRRPLAGCHQFEDDPPQADGLAPRQARSPH